MEKKLSSEVKTRLTPEEYLRLERASTGRKCEYFNGEMLPMPGVSREHVVITMNIGSELHRQFEDRPCEVYASDMRVKVSATGLYTYPDVIVICGEPVFEDQHVDVLINPTLLIEVLSDSTEAYDRGRKFSHYRTVESLQEYVLVAQNECRIDQYVRQADGTWLYTENTDPDRDVFFPSIASRVSLHKVYRRIEFHS